MAHKVISIENLYKDLGYIIHITEAADFLQSNFPPKKGMMVLESGSGSGKLGIGYAIKGCHVHMIDVDIDAIEYGRRLRDSYCNLWGPNQAVFMGKAIFNQVNLFDHHYAEDVFDLVFNEGVVQHFPKDPERQAAIDSMVRVCKPGGNVCIIGNNGMLQQEQKADQTTEFTYEGMPPNRKCFKPDELMMRLAAAGLQDIHCQPVTKEFSVPGMVGGGLDYSPLIAGWGTKP